MQQLDSKQLRWYNIATMGFIAVWGFGNVVNNYANQGLTVIVSWVLNNWIIFCSICINGRRTRICI